MAVFDFKLEGVLRHRKNLERERQRDLAGHNARMTQLNEELRALDASVRASEQDLRDYRLRGRIDLAFLAAHRRFAFSMQKKAMEVAQKMAAVRIAAEEARQKLVQAARARKSIEKLRERQFQAWQENLARHEIADLDEVAVQMSFHALAADESMEMPPIEEELPEIDA